MQCNYMEPRDIEKAKGLRPPRISQGRPDDGSRPPAAGFRVDSLWIQYPEACLGSEVAAAVTPLASRVTTAATRAGSVKCVGACSEGLYSSIP